MVVNGVEQVLKFGLSYRTECLVSAGVVRDDFDSRRLTDFHEDHEGRVLINCLEGLPFLPVNDVLDGWLELRPLFRQHFGTLAWLTPSSHTLKILIWRFPTAHSPSRYGTVV